MEPVKYCPFCGCTPTFTKAYEYDDRRAMRMRLECCVKMITGISWPDYAALTDAQLDAELRRDLTKEWNTRYTPEE